MSDIAAVQKELAGAAEALAREKKEDLYHEDFRDSIAVDVRIEAVSAA